MNINENFEKNKEAIYRSYYPNPQGRLINFFWAVCIIFTALIEGSDQIFI